MKKNARLKNCKRQIYRLPFIKYMTKVIFNGVNFRFVEFFYPEKCSYLFCSYKCIFKLAGFNPESMPRH